MNSSPHRNDRPAVLPEPSAKQGQAEPEPWAVSPVEGPRKGPPFCVSKLVASSTPDGLAAALACGRPWDLHGACVEFVATGAFLIDTNKLAARAIARVMMLAGGAPRAVEERLRDLIEAAAAPLIEGQGSAPGETPGEADEDLRSVLAKRLGVREAAIPAVQAAVNGYPIEDRRIVHGCLAVGLTPDACARRWGESPGTVRGMLAALTRYALEVDQALPKDPKERPADR